MNLHSMLATHTLYFYLNYGRPVKSGPQAGWRVRLGAGLSTLGSRRAEFSPPMDGDSQVLPGTGKSGSIIAYDGYGKLHLVIAGPAAAENCGTS